MIDIIEFYFQDLILPGRKDAQLLMQKRSTIPENNDKIKFDSLNMRTKKPRKTHNMRSRSHHHHELPGGFQNRLKCKA